VEALLVAATAHRLAGSPDLALRNLDQALSLAPASTEALYQRALVLLQQGDERGAEAELRDLLTVDATAADARVELARLLEKRGTSAEAAEQYREALRYVPDLEPALEGLARLQGGRG
jgi:Tfp pilus assembly protein PilF